MTKREDKISFYTARSLPQKHRSFSTSKCYYYLKLKIYVLQSGSKKLQTLDIFMQISFEKKGSNVPGQCREQGFMRAFSGVNEDESNIQRKKKNRSMFFLRQKACNAFATLKRSAVHILLLFYTSEILSRLKERRKKRQIFQR